MDRSIAPIFAVAVSAVLSPDVPMTSVLLSRARINASPIDAPTGLVPTMVVVGEAASDGCTVTDTGTAKVRAIQWAREAMPKTVSFVGGHPLIKSPLASLEDAKASVFDGADYCVIASPDADGDAVRTVVGLVESLGAKPLFLDAGEHDSYAAAMTYLPLVLSAALVTTTSEADGWREMHRLAASEFAELSRYAGGDPLDNEVASRASPDELVHWLDQMITTLYKYRNQIKENNDDLLDSLSRGLPPA